MLQSMGSQRVRQDRMTELNLKAINGLQLGRKEQSNNLCVR